jgi:hypothetical protein
VSEFQYYEFHAIDKPLSLEAQEEVSSMSSRVKLSPKKAVFSYSYGDFRYKEEKVVIDYFDFMFYMANWGQVRIILKFPVEIVDFDLLKRYKIRTADSFIEEIRVYKESGYVLVDINYSEEEGGGWIEENMGNQIVEIRREIIERDYRSLFLIWLRFLEMKYDNADFEEAYEFSDALIPANLSTLDGLNETIVEIFNVSEDWFKVLANFSESEATVDYKKRLDGLSKDQMLGFMAMILDDEPNLRAKLIHELRGGERKKAKKDQQGIKLKTIGEQVAQLRANKE